MVYYAETDGNTILRVIAFPTNIIIKDGAEDDATGSSYCSDQFNGTWIRISYPDERPVPLEYNRPYPSWISNSRNEWFAPDPAPQGAMFNWNEDTTSWVEIPIT